MTYDSQNGTILVVDDNGDIRTLTKRLLESAGWRVVTAMDGEEGLRFYEKHRSAIVLLLTDVVMPRMNGFELADCILWVDSQLPVLLMSGDAGCDYRGLECISKPFRPTELIETVSRVLSANAHSQKSVSTA